MNFSEKVLEINGRLGNLKSSFRIKIDEKKKTIYADFDTDLLKVTSFKNKKDLNKALLLLRFVLGILELDFLYKKAFEND